MKRIVLLFLLLSLIAVTLCACDSSDFYIEEQDLNSNLYKSAWCIFTTHLADVDCYERMTPPSLFPASVWGADFEDSYYRIDSQSPINYSKLNYRNPLQGAFQLAMSIRYDEEAFQTEVSRLEAFAPMEQNENFDLPAVISVLGWEECSEYALIDAQNRTVHYIYLESVPKENIKISSEHVPLGYKDSGTVIGEERNIYLSMTEAEKVDIAQSRR